MLPAGQLPPIGHKGSCRASGAQRPPRASVRRNRNTPLIQSRAVDLPPGMLLMSQLFPGAVRPARPARPGRRRAAGGGHHHGGQAQLCAGLVAPPSVIGARLARPPAGTA
ncbi:putative cytosolic protein [Roseomonas mucosa]|uniref:Putative cytosolic protein n=1 Tax=Roseomonas mucosa TaxID=207340 RepID=A0A4Y1N1C2_9PROT|nr:putative cytosolic protein [Roseomonas mucosa]UZO97808.1 putative cytosolic protein [Roseomonas mucosa]